MTTATSDGVKQAARRLVNGFSCIPQAWAAKVAEHIDGDECVAMPVGGYLKVEDSCDERKIRSMLVSLGVTEDDDITDIREFIQDKGLDVDPEEFNWYAEDDDEDDYDIDELVDAVNEAWRDSYDEDCHLADSGWMAVADTGILAREFDGCLLLGINGGGYDFYEAHWMPLYLAMGYGWHK